MYLQRPQFSGEFCNASVRAHYDTHMCVYVYVYACVSAYLSLSFLQDQRENASSKLTKALFQYLIECGERSSRSYFFPRRAKKPRMCLVTTTNAPCGLNAVSLRSRKYKNSRFTQLPFVFVTFL